MEGHTVNKSRGFTLFPEALRQIGLRCAKARFCLREGVHENLAELSAAIFRELEGSALFAAYCKGTPLINAANSPAEALARRKFTRRSLARAGRVQESRFASAENIKADRGAPPERRRAKENFVL